MYERCVACGKHITQVEDCKLVLGGKDNILTYCKDCYEKRVKKTK